MTEPQYDAPPENVENVENVPSESAASEMPAPTQTPEGTESTRRGRGRPRTRETIDRDQAVIDALRNGPRTREQLAEQINQPTSLVYLALWRLSHENPPRVVKTSEGGSRHAWQLT